MTGSSECCKCGSVEAIYVYLAILFEYFINSLTAFVSPGVISFKIAGLFDSFVGFIRYYSMAPSIIHYAHPVLSIRCFRITNL
ncbi:hypothetical protein Leryth_023204, partial [Lithospermum erythrorhizon]